MPRSNAARAASRCHSRAFGASRMRRTGADFYALRRGYLTPDAPMVPSTANARLTGTPMPFHRQWTTGCCRKHLLPIGVTGVFRGHAENCVQIQWVPEPRDYPATRVVALWPSAHYGAIRGDVIYDPPRFARTIVDPEQTGCCHISDLLTGISMPLALMECAPACPYQIVDLYTAHRKVFHESGLDVTQVLTPAICLFCHHDQLLSSNLGG